MKPWMTWAAAGVVAVVAVLWIVLAISAHERDLDRRCEAAGGRRVRIDSDTQKLCFTEGWRWVKI